MKNLIYCLCGVALGFAVGFYAANTIAPHDRVARPPQARQLPPGGGAAPGGAGGGQLPPDHPDISGMGGGGSPASTSPEAQAAMEAADSRPRDAEAQAKAAEVFYRLQDAEKAELYATRAIDLNPDDYKSLVLLGNARYDARDYVAAAGFYERALAVNPRDPNVRTDYGNTFFLRVPPDYDRAIAEYRKSIELDARHEQSWMNLASASVEKRDRAAALQAISRLEAINPQHTSLPSLKQRAEAIQ